MICCRIAIISLLISLTAEADYETQIRPLLEKKCVACHGTLKQAGGLRLDYGKAIHQGGESGPVISLDDANASLLLQKVRAEEHEGRMPPQGEGERLSDEQIAQLQRWIEEGAKFPDNEPVPADPATWWSYRPVARPEVPSVADDAQRRWIRNPIDAFVAQKHSEYRLRHSQEARPEVLLRRVYLDLIGLPPTPDELSAFLNDKSADRYERVVDSLLQRPEYGQRWGRHWMDVWRYSDWYGSRSINEIRYSQRHIWRWRDWIVESLNDDKPYSQMITEMIAGDELAAADPETLRATGFLGRNWYKFDRNVWMFETVEQTSQAFLGLTIRCARCHDHKFDPITQEDYYRFRAFFEAHDVRTDPWSGNMITEKDATLGDVLKEGVSRVFDKEVDAPTYLFARGDNRYPDTSRIIAPGVPSVLGGSVAVEPVELPLEAWYPSLRPSVIDGALLQANEHAWKAQENLRIAQQELRAAEEQLSRAEQAAAAASDVQTVTNPVLSDRFESQSTEWKIVSGSWQWVDGKLIQDSVTSFATIVAAPKLPMNFQAKVRYRTLQPGGYRSVGFSFDYVDQGNSQDVYTSTGDKTQTVQAFHRLNGQQSYPAAGIVPVQLKVGDETTVEITVRGTNLSINLNGERKLDYVMPTARREGQFALWVHNGSAEFLEVEVTPIEPGVDELRAAVRLKQHAVKVCETRQSISYLQLRSLQYRINAELMRYRSAEPAEIKSHAENAAESERLLEKEKLIEELLNAEFQYTEATQSSASNSEELKLKANEIRQKIVELEAKIAAPGTEYTPLGPTYPRTSSGRRLALARWIADQRNPRTSRIAVNHIWLRHFGEALVPTVANFGLNGAPPTHPELLDWLSAELMEQNWQMKPIHRLIVTSATYRQASATADETGTRFDSNQIDAANRWYWRMNSRRMEAEIVRDSVLWVSGQLDTQLGGPEVPETEIQTVFRRSLYFRNTPNEKSSLLEPFDVANPNECYRRQESVIPQQALAMMNSGLAVDSARILAERLTAGLTEPAGDERLSEFVDQAFKTILTREPHSAERELCVEFLKNMPDDSVPEQSDLYPAGPGTAKRPPSSDPQQRACENLVLVLLSHNDFVTIR